MKRMKKSVSVCIYNETNEGWNITPTSDERTQLIHKSYNRKSSTQGETKERSISIGIQEDACRNKILYKLLSSVEKKGEVVPLFGDPVSVGFSKKTMEPYVKKSDTTNDRILSFISINTNNRKLCNLESKGCQIIEFAFDVTKHELHMIVSSHIGKSSLILTFFDGTSNMYNKYSFCVQGGKIFLDKYNKVCKRKEKVKSIKLRKYRPYKPTQYILTYKKDVNDLRKLLKGRNFNLTSHKIETIDKKEEQIINRLLSTGYRAVTVYKVKNNNYKQIDELTSPFKVVYDLKEDGKVFQKRI